MNVNVDVRIGKVTDVNKKKRLVRVKFEDYFWLAACDAALQGHCVHRGGWAA